MTHNEMIAQIANLLLLDVAYVEQNAEEIEDGAGLYFSEPIMGGRSIIVAPDGSVLFAHSSIGYDEHLRAFLTGTRTPKEDFDTQA